MTHEIKQADKTVLFAAVPASIQPKLIKYPISGLYLMDGGSKELNAWKTKLPPGEWELIGLYPGLTEEQAQRVVESFDMTQPFQHSLYEEKDIRHKDYTNPQYFQKITAIESIATLMQRERLYTVNPYGDKEPEDIDFEYEYIEGEYEPEDDFDFDKDEWKRAHDKWQEAQARTSAVWAVLVRKGGKYE